MRAQFEAFMVQEWQQGSIWQIILRPLSWLFAFITAIRRFFFRVGISKITRVGVPVIVVGNISAGGTGKTPLVIAIAELLEKSNRHPGVVTRGYRQSRAMPRTFAPPVPVLNPQQAAITASDEALLMSQRLTAPVFANPDRVAAVAALLKRYPQTDVVISDDGLQHYRLGRDLEIAVVDGARGFGNQHLIPAGPLRESTARLKTVDCIVVNGVPKIGLNLEHDLDQYGPPVFRMNLGHEAFRKLGATEAVSIEEFREQMFGKKIHAVAGIGNPQRFFDHLERLGLYCTATHPFSDHHAFKRSELTLPDADIILMTEKDAVKCKAFADERMFAMRVDAILPPEFDHFILQHLTAIAAAKSN